MKWKAVKFDANTLQGVQGVKFMYLTRNMSPSRYEAHRVPNHPDMWLLSRGVRFDERKGRNVTDAELLKLFKRVGGFPDVSEHTVGNAFVTQDPYWKPRKKRPTRDLRKPLSEIAVKQLKSRGIDPNSELVRSLVDKFLSQGKLAHTKTAGQVPLIEAWGPMLREASGVDGFMSDYRSMTFDNFLDPRSRVWSYAKDGERLPLIMTEIETTPAHEAPIWFKSIISPQRQGTGQASAILRKVTDLADKHGVSIWLNPKPFGRVENALSASKLKGWYKRHGWEPTYGDVWIRQPAGMKTAGQGGQNRRSHLMSRRAAKGHRALRYLNPEDFKSLNIDAAFEMPGGFEGWYRSLMKMSPKELENKSRWTDSSLEKFADRVQQGQYIGSQRHPNPLNENYITKLKITGILRDPRWNPFKKLAIGKDLLIIAEWSREKGLVMDPKLERWGPAMQKAEKAEKARIQAEKEQRERDSLRDEKIRREKAEKEQREREMEPQTWSVAQTGYDLDEDGGDSQGYVAEVAVFDSKSEAVAYARDIGKATVVKGTQMWNEPVGQVEEHGREAWTRYYR